MPLCLTKPDPAADPGYYYVPDAQGDPTLPYVVRQVGNTVHVVVKAREAGFARYSITLGATEVYRGPARGGPWALQATVRYRMQYYAGGTWQNVDAQHLENPSLTYVEDDEFVTVRRQANVIGHAATLRWATRYGIVGQKFVAEDRVRCDGVDVSTVRRKLRLIKRVTLAADSDALVTADDFLEDGSRPHRRKFGSVIVGWRQHVTATGDEPRLRMDRATRSIEVICHEAGVDALDVDPHTIIDDANTYVIPMAHSNTGTRAIARNSLGHTVVLYADVANTSLWAAYTTVDPPTQTADWTYVKLVGSGGKITDSDTGGDDLYGFYASLCLRPDEDWLHVIFGNASRRTQYSVCDVSGGMSAIATASNWKNADRSTTGSEEIHTDRCEPGIVISDGAGKVAVCTHYGGFTLYDGSWSAQIVVGDTINFDMAVESDGTLWYCGVEIGAAPDELVVRSVAFADAATLGNWSAETTVIDDATYAAYRLATMAVGAASAPNSHIAVAVKSNDTNAVYLNYSNDGGGSWNGTDDTGSSGRGKVSFGATPDGYLIVIYGLHTATLNLRTDNEGTPYANENATYGDPTDRVRASIEIYPPGKSTWLGIVGDDGADIEFEALTVSAGTAWWGGNAAAGQPTMRRWNGVPFMTPGPAPQGRTW